MQYKQKNFLMAALTGVLSIVVLTAGDCGPSGGGSSSGNPNEKTLTYTEVSALSETDTYKNKDISKIAISGDAGFAYVINNANAGIRVFKNDDAKKISANLTDKNKWKDVAIKGDSTNGAGAAISKVDLAQAATVKAINPYGVGAVITTNGGATNANQQGVILMKGDVKEKTYSTSAVGSIHADGGGNAGGAGALGMAVVASIGAAPGTETLLALKADGTVGAHVVLTVDTLLAAGVGAGVPGVAVLGRAFVATPGLNFIAKAATIERMSVVADFIPVGATSYDSAIATNEWKHDNAVPNGDINALAFAGGNLYVGLNRGAANTGGVVIIQGATAAAGTAVKIDAATKDKTVHAFAVRKNGEVFAFAGDKIFVFKAAATKPIATYDAAFVTANKGNITDGSAKAGWLGDLSMTQMNSGAWLSDDTLLVGDATAGLATINFKADKKVIVKQ